MSFWDRIKKIDLLRHERKTASDKPDPCEEREFPHRYKQKKINVFISSTFKDMKAERDELTLRVFPALRKVCEERRITWGEVDLRWGIPEEKKGEVLEICLKCIDDCRPYFIGILGERYGWVDNHTSDRIINDYPWIGDYQEKSITELEILYGVLNNPSMEGNVFFYFRDPAYVSTFPIEQQSDFLELPLHEDVTKLGIAEAKRRSAERQRKVTSLKETIRRAKVPIHENYRDPVHFGELVRQDLMHLIDLLVPTKQPPSSVDTITAEFDDENINHEAFAARRFGIYIQQKKYFDLLDAHVAGTGSPLVVLGEPGSGKSALLAHWALRYRNLHPDTLVVIHFVGASSQSTDITLMLLRIISVFSKKFSLSKTILDKDDPLLIPDFKNWLAMAAEHGRVVLVIDALNDLTDRNGAPDLDWLPLTLPANICLLLSTLPGRSLDVVKKRGWPTMTVEHLTVSERDALIICYLKKYRKELSSKVREELANAPQCENPLFLRTVLEEIRIHGTFETLTDQIREYLSALTVEELYAMLLARYEKDYERDRFSLVKDAVSLIWASRNGLTKSELMDLLGTGKIPLPDAYWVPLYLAMEHSLIEKDGKITFSHDYFRQAIEHRYLPTDEIKQQMHMRIADYFAVQTEGIRRIEELPWQLVESSQWDRLVALLKDPSFFLAVWDAAEYDLKRFWVRAERESSYHMAETYQSVIRHPENFPAIFVGNVTILLIQMGYIDVATPLLECLIETSRAAEDYPNLKIYLGHLGAIFFQRGDLDGAMALFKEQEQICRKLGDLGLLPNSLNNQAGIHLTRGNLDEALSCYVAQQKICYETGNLDALQTCFGNAAHVFEIRGDFNAANVVLKHKEQICRQIGDISGLQVSLCNQASILIALGDFESARVIYSDAEKVYREIGELELLAACLNNHAVILRDIGDVNGAFSLLKEGEQICQFLKNKKGLADNFSNQALCLKEQGNRVGAMVLLKEQEQIYRELNDLNAIIGSLGNQANIVRIDGDLDGALTLYQEAETISRDIGNVQYLATILINESQLFLEKECISEARLAAQEAFKLTYNHGYKALASQALKIMENLRR